MRSRKLIPATQQIYLQPLHLHLWSPSCSPSTIPWPSNIPSRLGRCFKANRQKRILHLCWLTLQSYNLVNHSRWANDKTTIDWIAELHICHKNILPLLQPYWLTMVICCLIKQISSNWSNQPLLTTTITTILSTDPLGSSESTINPVPTKRRISPAWPGLPASFATPATLANTSPGQVDGLGGWIGWISCYWCLQLLHNNITSYYMIM